MKTVLEQFTNNLTSHAKLFAIALFVFAMLLPQVKVSASEKGFQQPEFAIGFWVDPPVDNKADMRYKEIADANFTLVLGLYGPQNLNQIQQQVALCKKYGLNVLVRARKEPVEPLPDDPCCWGYMIKDEPSTKEFKELAAVVERNRQARPDKMSFINLFPNYASKKQLQADSYDEYVSKFVEVVKPQVLCMDHYPRFRPDRGDPMPKYRDNLVTLKNVSEKAGIPFWMFFNVMPYGPHTNPTEAQIRWQIFTSVAYGAKGVLYFCYYTPRGGEFPKGGAIIDINDRKTGHYEQAKRINAELKNLGPVLMKLKPVKVINLEGKKEYSGQTLAGTALASLRVAERNDPSLDVEVGTFKHQDGRDGVMIVNNSITYAIWPTLTFDAPMDKVVEIDKQNGKEITVYDESPDIPGLQISLDPGDGRLFLIKK